MRNIGRWNEFCDVVTASVRVIPCRSGQRSCRQPLFQGESSDWVYIGELRYKEHKNYADSYKDGALYLFRSYEQGLVLYAAAAQKDDTEHVQPLLENVLAIYSFFYSR